MIKAWKGKIDKRRTKMQTIDIKNIPLRLANLATRPSLKSVEVDSVQPQFRFDKEAQKSTEEVVGFKLNFIGVKGILVTVKLPLSVEEKIATIAKELDGASIVKVNFGNPSTLKAYAYAYVDRATNLLRTGINASAQTLEIVEIESPDDFDDFQID